MKRRSSICCSVCGAKSECPPSEGTTRYRPPSHTRIDWPRPVPAASSARVPPGSGLPGFRTQKSSGGRCSILWPVAPRSFKRTTCEPRIFRGSHAAIDHRPGDAEAGGYDAFLAEMFGRLPRELLDDALELRELLACEALLEDGRERAAFFRKERQITLRPANIPCKDQLFPLTRLVSKFYVRCCNYGLYHCLPSRSSRRSDSFGPQFPAGYCGTVALLAALQTSMMGSTSDQAASTLSPRSKSVASPRTQSFKSVE